jgi:hypothetical protein
MGARGSLPRLLESDFRQDAVNPTNTTSTSRAAGRSRRSVPECDALRLRIIFVINVFRNCGDTIPSVPQPDKKSWWTLAKTRLIQKKKLHALNV